MSENSAKKRIFSQNLDIKPSLEFYKGWVYSRTLLHSRKNWLTKDPARLESSQVFSLFRKWYNRVSKVPKITAYVNSCDVIGHDAILNSDIAFERSGLKLCVLQVMGPRYDSIATYRRFSESLFSLKFVYKSQKLASKSLRIQDPKNSAEDGTLNLKSASMLWTILGKYGEIQM